MRYWKRVDREGKTTTVESYSHSLEVKGAIEIDKAESDTFIASLPPPLPPEPARNLAAEIDKLKAKVTVFEERRIQ